MASGVDSCANTKCGKDGWTRWCSGCKHVAYCSRECQKSDWPSHKKVCKSLHKALLKKQKVIAEQAEFMNHDFIPSCVKLTGVAFFESVNIPTTVPPSYS